MSTGAANKRVPLSLYRTQLGPDFGFEACLHRLSYLKSLGITTIYLSPLWEARKGSLHGYDVIAANRISGKLGGSDGFDRLAGALDSQHPEMSLVLDIVPNHMSFSYENERVNDVLQHGPCSPYASHFDIDWASRVAKKNTLALPILGESYLDAISKRHIRLEFFRDDFRFAICYFDHKFPVCPRSLQHLMPLVKAQAKKQKADRIDLTTACDELQQLAAAIPASQNPERAEERLERSQKFSRRFKSHMLQTTRFPQFLELALEALASTEGSASETLHKIVYCQAYQFFYWKTGLHRRNYRTFFDIAELIATNLSHDDAFEYLHTIPVSLMRRPSVIGLRVDHIDGIRNPSVYLAHLSDFVKKRAGKDLPWVWVEKVLADGEFLPVDWSASGTTGYDFLGSMTRFLCAPNGVTALRQKYSHREDLSEATDDAVEHILSGVFSSRFDKLCADLKQLVCGEPMMQDFGAPQIRSGLRSFLKANQRSRYYLSTEIADVEGQITEMRAVVARMHIAEPEEKLFMEQLIVKIKDLMVRYAAGQSVEKLWRIWFEDLQCLIVPTQAKAIEDTLLYRETFCLNYCEVGVTPESQRIGINDLHQFFIRRARFSRMSINTTSTHDTKRSEDVRCRLAVLTEVHKEWASFVDRSNEINKDLLHDKVREVFLSHYSHFFYQSLYGIYWPQIPKNILSDRLVRYFRKALREGKEQTNWYTPNSEFERHFLSSIEKLVLQEDDSPFFQLLNAFFKRFSSFGALNSLNQVLIKCTAPGIPDIYQGCEVWNHCLVDPDNRHSIEFDGLVRRMATIEHDLKRASHADLLRKLMSVWEDGRVKMYVLMRLLHLRQAYPELFMEGDYRAVECEGPRAGHVFAFLRTHKQKRLLVVATRGLLSAFPSRTTVTEEWDWGKHSLQLSEFEGASWREVFTGDSYQDIGKRMHLGLLLRTLPFACLESV